MLARRPLFFFAVAFIPYFVLQLGFVFLVGVNPTGATPSHGSLSPIESSMRAVISILVFWPLILSIQAAIARSAITFQLGHGLRLGTALMSAMVSILPIVLLGFVTSLIWSLGALLLIVPGLYLAAAFYALTPAIVYEDVGWRAMSRTLELTRGYRWSIVAVILVTLTMSVLIIVGLTMAHQLGAPLVGLYDGVQLYAPAALLLLILIDSLTTGLTYPIAMIAIAMTYLRLREIKGDGSADALLEIFE